MKEVRLKWVQMYDSIFIRHSKGKTIGSENRSVVDKARDGRGED